MFTTVVLSYSSDVLTVHRVDTQVSMESKHPVELVEEPNYMFDLDRVKPQLLDWAIQSDGR
jgi:methionyl-tRNA synthetase